MTEATHPWRIQFKVENNWHTVLGMAFETEAQARQALPAAQAQSPKTEFRVWDVRRKEKVAKEAGLSRTAMKVDTDEVGKMTTGFYVHLREHFDPAHGLSVSLALLGMMAGTLQLDFENLEPMIRAAIEGGRKATY